MNPIQILDYKPEHQPWFDQFNRAWIEELFEMEPLDEWVLTNPGEAILETGGAILMAAYNGIIAGTVALRKLDDSSYEFTKMAVDKNFRRKGIAEAISYASFRKAKELGAKKVILYSNTRNAGAVKLYEKIGFTHMQVENDIYKRANVKMMIDIDRAIHSAEKFDQHKPKSMSLRIIEADASYSEAITSIGRKSFYDAFVHLFNSKEELLEYLVYSYDPVKIAKSISKEKNLYFVAILDDVPVGFVKIKKHSLNSQIESGAQMELQKIYVLSENHDKGIGLALMNKTIQYAQLARTDYIWLNVHISNEKAIRFYRKRGFDVAGKHFFSIGTQTFEFHLMQLQIDKKEQLLSKPENILYGTHK